MDLKIWADNATDFINRYRHVQDVYTDKDGLALLSDMAFVFGCEINVRLEEKEEPTP